MFYNFRDVGSLKNARLHSLVLQARQLEKADCWENGETVLTLIKKILPFAKKEKEWYLYLETFAEMLSQERTFGDELLVIKYAPVFFGECNVYMEKAMAQIPNGTLPKIISSTYEAICDCYMNSAQIDDKKWEAFWKSFKSISEQNGLASNYWIERLEFAALYNRDFEMAKKSIMEYERQFKDYQWMCYGCHSRVIMGYYLMIDDIDKVNNIVNQIISRNVPQEAFWIYNRCTRVELERIYNDILNSSVLVGNKKAFDYFLPSWLELWRAKGESQSNTTAVTFRLAAAGDFSELEKNIEIAVEDAQNCTSTPGFIAMKEMLSWAAYFKKLVQSGIVRVNISCQAKNFPVQDEKGYCKSDMLSAWFEERADELGSLFEKRREKFCYRNLKESFLVCCHVQD